MGASSASHGSGNVSTKQPSKSSIIHVDVISREGKLQHRWNDAAGGSTIANLRERLRTKCRLVNGHVRCKGRVLADSETLGSLRPSLVGGVNGIQVFDLSLSIDGFVPQAQTQITVEVSSSAGDLVSCMDATSETTVVELNIRLQKDSHGFQKVLLNGRILADFEALGSLCTNSAGATMNKLSLQSEYQEPFAFAFECFQSKKFNIKTTCNITVDQITSEILDRFATPDPTCYTEESHAWLLGILRGNEYSAVLDSNPEHAARLMALVSSPLVAVKVLRYSQGKIQTGLRESTTEVLIAGHRVMLLKEDRVEADPAPAPAPAPIMWSQKSYTTSPPPTEELKATDEEWLSSKCTATVLTIDIQRHDAIQSIHVSCQMLSGEEAMSADLSAEATLTDLESVMQSTLKWFQLEFVSENGKVDVSEPLKAYSTLTAKEVPMKKGGIDEHKCRRCGGEYISVQRTTEWCQMNGDAGGTLNSWCKTCGLQLSTSWSDD